MLSCYCDIEESKDKKWVCPFTDLPQKCPHNLWNDEDRFPLDEKLVKILRRYHIILGFLFLLTPFFPLSIFCFIGAASIKTKRERQRKERAKKRKEQLKRLS